MSGLTLGSVEFPSVFVSSGTLNFFGEGWPFHSFYEKIFGKGFDFSCAGFISKTTTVFAREGNMFLKENLQPRELKPACIKVYPLKGAVLNSVDLSGPGLCALLDAGKWQLRDEPFMVSYMSLGDTISEKLQETKKFVDLMESVLDQFKAPIGIQVNVSCPNTHHPTSDMLKNASVILAEVSLIGVPVDLKVGVADMACVGRDFVEKIEKTALCDCLTCSNTIPWGKLPEFINWKDLFGSERSPLEHLGGGGLSGKPLKPIVLEWLRNVRQSGITMPIKVGGGILSEKDAEDYVYEGASALELGCVSILRPLRVKGIIQTGNKLFSP